MALVRRERPIRDAVSEVSKTIGTTARVFSGAVEIGALYIEDFKEDAKLDLLENQMERTVRRAQLEAQQAEQLKIINGEA